MPAASWQDAILSEFTPGVSPLTVVADPDGPLQDDEILATLQRRGFSLLRFEDPIAFRYAYESRYRGREVSADAQGLIVLVPAQPSALDNLPHDILARSRRLACSLAELFPSLNEAVVSALEPADRASLHEAVSLQQPAALGANASKDFVLRHVFHVAPELVRTPRRTAGSAPPPALCGPARSTGVGCAVHPSNRRALPRLAAREHRAGSGGVLRFPATALADVPGCERGDGPGGVGDRTDALASVLPFDHEDVRVYIDNLFAEGLLQPISHWRASTLSKTWLGVGVQWDARQDAAAKLDRLLATAEDTLPNQESRHQDWFRFAKVRAGIAALTHEPNGKPNEKQQQAVDGLRTRMDAAFSDWVAS